MARTKNTRHAPRPPARSAAPAAQAPAPAPAAPPAPGDPAAAVHAALVAAPGGATTARIADAAGTSRPAARDALTALETAGAVTRTKGGKPGIPDTWTLITAGEARHEPGVGTTQDGKPAVSSQPGNAPTVEDQDGPGEQEASGGTGQQEGSDDPDILSTAAGQAALPDSSPGEPDTGTKPEKGEDEPAGDAETSPGGSPAAGDSGSAGEPPAPGLVAEVAGRIEQIQSAASAASTTLADGGDLRVALAGMDEVYDQATQARRALKAAVGGKKAPAARPGGLRDKILGHLRDHPSASFTPHEIHKVLNHSSGAIANALDTLVKHGHAELATEKPRRFRLTSGTGAPAEDHAPAQAQTEATDAGDDTDLAGAA